MNYEEKYKEALDKLKKGLAPVDGKEIKGVTKSFLEEVFPELRESEDEKIRKEIIKLVHFFYGSSSVYEHHVPEDNMIAWLEKQGEKSVDETKPKFKVGDWITNGEHTWKVTDIKPLDYILQSQNGDTVDDTISYVDEEFHLWTIQDAKDGDVLSQDSIPFIFKSWDNNCIAYCGITGFGLFKVVEDYFSWCNGINVTPATKEQRDLLFQKMKEAGYEWDAEKRELKKIEQNPAWSEEDEKMIDFMIEFIESLCWRKDLTKRKNEVLFWLKSLKPQQKQELSNEDIKIIKMIEDCLRFYKMTHCATLPSVETCIDWLNSLKPQSHWKPTEEQMRVLQTAIKDYGVSHEKSIFESLYNDLKSL